jgi:hypothetical protein
MHDLIRREATGSCEEFAGKLGISKSMLMIDLNELREIGATIEYCPYRKSYFFAEPFEFILGAKQDRIKGGETCDLVSLMILDYNILSLNRNDWPLQVNQAAETEKRMSR